MDTHAIPPEIGGVKLPDPLPADPMPMLAVWFEEAKRVGTVPNPDAMALATSTPDGRPSVRIVLCRGIETTPGSVLFFTNYTSRKGAEIESNARVAAVFHWDHLGRQARIEGTVERTSDRESDAYFAGRPLLSQLGAWASEQSQPIDARFRLLDRLGTVMARFGVGTGDSPSVRVPRPPHWGGYRIRLDAVELWVGGDYRLHDRAVWEREWPRGSATGRDLGPTAWTATRRQP